MTTALFVARPGDNAYRQAIGMWVSVGGAWRAVQKQWIWGPSGAGQTWRLGYTSAPALASIVVSPNPATCSPGGTVQFGAEGFDSLGNDMGSLTPLWSCSGSGSIDSSGLYHSTLTEETLSVTATVGSVSGSAICNVTST